MILYRTLYLLKCLAAVALILGWGGRWPLLILAASFLVEIRLYFKFHTNLLFLVTMLLFFAPEDVQRIGVPQAVALFGGNTDPSLHGDLFVSWLLVLTMSIVYIATARRKCHRAFLSGEVVLRTVEFSYLELARRLGFDGWYPAPFLATMVLVPNAARRWAPLMWLTVGLELVLPIWLLLGPMPGMAVVAGVLMHLGFTLLYPATLLHFSLLSVGTYLLYLQV